MRERSWAKSIKATGVKEDSEKYPTCSLKSHLKKSLTWRNQTRVVSERDGIKKKMEIKIDRLNAFNEFRNARKPPL